MQRKSKYVLFLFALLLIITNLHFWNIIKIFNFYKDIEYDTIGDLKNETKSHELDEDDDISEEPMYADEGFTEEEIRLFGPLEEREVICVLQNILVLINI